MARLAGSGEENIENKALAKVLFWRVYGETIRLRSITLFKGPCRKYSFVFGTAFNYIAPLFHMVDVTLQ